MNTKKILSLVLVLAMIVTMAPSFSLVASADVGEEIEVNGTRYRIVGENLVTNGGFEDGLDGWNSVGANNAIQASGGSEQSTEQVHSGEYAYKQVSNGGGQSGNNLFRHIPLNGGEPAGDGKTYVLSFWRYGGNGITLTVGLTASTNTVQVDESCGGLGNSDQSPVNCNLTGLPSNEWHQLSYVLTANEASAYAEIYARWCEGQFFDDVTLYEVEEEVDTVDTVENPDSITVISGNAPLLPETLAAKGELGSNMTVDVVWDTTGIDFSTPGTYPVNGTAEGSYPVSVNVTVLPETFALPDLTSKNTGQGTLAGNVGSYLSFPVGVTGDATIEFDLTWINQTVNQVIGIINADAVAGTLWGGTQQIQLGMDGSGTFTANNRGGTSATVTLSKGTYRVLITTNVESGQYTIKLTDSNGNVVLNSDTLNYRTSASPLDTFLLMTNGGGNDGDMVATNFKVYAPSAESQFAEYTVNITGSVTGSYTERAVSAEDVSVPYYEGNVLKTRTVNGTTINLEYAASEETLGTWAIRNNIDTVSGNKWITEMRYLGTHDSFTDKMQGNSDYADEAGVLYGDSGAVWASYFPGIALNMSKAQSMDALEQLNAGVRYFDIRLSRQEDGTFWTRHGLLSENFEGIAYTIAQFAAENPGEVIILDFQSTFDAMYTEVISGGNNGGSEGDDNEAVYAALVELLHRTGITQYVPSNWDQQYNQLTNNGTEAKIILLCKERGASAQSIFVNRSTVFGSGSIYTENDNVNEVIDFIDANYTNINDSGPYFGAIHAYTTGSNLISDAAANNATFLAATNFKNWFQNELHATFLLMDGLTEDYAAQALARMQEYNRDGFDGTYTNTVSGVTIEGPTAAVPFSTTAAVTAKDTEDGTDYTFTLTQFSSTSATFNGVSLTFPAEASDASAKTLVIKNGAVIGMADGGSNVTVENQTVTSSDVYSVIAVSAPTLTAELGWDDYNQRFAIDFVTGNVDFTTGYTYGVDFYAGSADAFVGDATVTAENPYAGISTDKTNLVYAARPWVQITGQADKILGTPVYTSIYKLVTEDIEASGYTADSNFNPDRTAAAVEVIRAGGMFADDNGTLTDEMLNIVTDNGDGTYTLIDSAQAVGIRFTDGEGSYSETIRVEGSTVTLVDPVLVASVAEELFVLEEVELVYVPELVEESVVNEQVEIDLDFEEIL